MEGTVAGQMRIGGVSFAGELGGKFTVQMMPHRDLGRDHWCRCKTIRNVGLELTSDRKGYRAWKGDLSTDYSLLEGGLDRFVKWTRG